MMIKSTAEHSIIQGYLSRYELALKAASEITSLDKQTIYEDTYNHGDDSNEFHYDFINSAYLTTPGNGYRALHNWIFHQSRRKPK